MVLLNLWNRLAVNLIGHGGFERWSGQEIQGREYLRASRLGVLFLIILGVAFIGFYLLLTDVFILETSPWWHAALRSLAFFSMAAFLTGLLYLYLRLVLFFAVENSISPKELFYLYIKRMTFLGLLLGFSILVALPLQVRVLSQDISAGIVIERWGHLNEKALGLNPEIATATKLDDDECVNQLLRPSVFLDPDQNRKKVKECRGRLEMLKKPGEPQFQSDIELLGILEENLRPVGLIERTSLGFERAPILSAAILVLMGLLFISPFLLLFVEGKRGYQYLIEEASRAVLVFNFHIEPKAVVVHDEGGKEKFLSRFWGVNARANAMREEFQHRKSNALDSVTSSRNERSKDKTEI